MAFVKLNQIINSVKEYSERPNPYTDWNDFWLDYKLNVNKIITWLSKQFIFDYENVQIAEYLKDLAVFDSNFIEKNFAKQSIKAAKEILKVNDYSKQDINYIIDEIILGTANSTEYKVLQSAEAFYELKSDFFLQLLWNRYSLEDMNLAQAKKWIGQRLDNNLKRISFDILKSDAEKYYYSYKNILEHESHSDNTSL